MWQRSIFTEELQKNAWSAEIDILKNQLASFEGGYLILEYTIPRIGKRIDGVFIYRGIVFLLEFKVGSNTYLKNGLDQVINYALDLNNLHKESCDKLLVPILMCTETPSQTFSPSIIKDKILNPLCCNQDTIAECITAVVQNYIQKDFSPHDWINSIYAPTPTIIETAKALYYRHKIEEISKNDSGAINLTRTTEAINEIIDRSKEHGKKSICFDTGVPGTEKTLAGLT